ncbi:F-box/LRR-repeat protein [Dorcoceras hygrometricum]|uniref:F-box/LRR-repeat protein n=1 Tax=Dorcoceras hygrometricum TaxID=472368 RepID=A0A2Z7CWR8_9LAMI|nr:F-box/LRR-repeat protein [Dorcoceras hygrometricum]
MKSRKQVSLLGTRSPIKRSWTRIISAIMTPKRPEPNPRRNQTSRHDIAGVSPERRPAGGGSTIEIARRKATHAPATCAGQSRAIMRYRVAHGPRPVRWTAAPPSSTSRDVWRAAVRGTAPSSAQPMIASSATEQRAARDQRRNACTSGARPARPRRTAEARDKLRDASSSEDQPCASENLGSDTTVGIRIAPPGEAAEEQKNRCRETINTVKLQAMTYIGRLEFATLLATCAWLQPELRERRLFTSRSSCNSGWSQAQVASKVTPRETPYEWFILCCYLIVLNVSRPNFFLPLPRRETGSGSATVPQHIGLLMLDLRLHGTTQDSTNLVYSAAPFSFSSLSAPPPPRAAASFRRTCSGHHEEEIPFVSNSSTLLVQTDEGAVFPVVDRIRRSTVAYLEVPFSL